MTRYSAAAARPDRACDAVNLHDELPRGRDNDNLHLALRHVDLRERGEKVS